MAQSQPFRVVRKNVPSSMRRDLYHSLLSASWTKTLGIAFGLFLLTNGLFATLYWAQPGSRTNSDGSWASAFFFSVQTLGTIGYGYLAPATTYANVLVTIEAALGFILVAIATGLFFAKFSRPFAKIEFTDKLVVYQFDGKPTLVFRMVNIRENQIMDATVGLTMLREHVTPEGHKIRRFLDLKLVRSSVPFFAMSMNLMHVIDEQSPLYGITPGNCEVSTSEILVTMIGTDGTMGQTIHATKSYSVKDIVWNKRFKDMVELTADGTRVVDYASFNVLVD